MAGVPGLRRSLGGLTRRPFVDLPDNIPSLAGGGCLALRHERETRTKTTRRDYELKTKKRARERLRKGRKTKTKADVLWRYKRRSTTTGGGSYIRPSRMTWLLVYSSSCLLPCFLYVAVFLLASLPYLLFFFTAFRIQHLSHYHPHSPCLLNFSSFLFSYYFSLISFFHTHSLILVALLSVLVYSSFIFFHCLSSSLSALPLTFFVFYPFYPFLTFSPSSISVFLPSANVY